MSSNLDGSNSIPWSHEHAEYCICAFLLTELWDQYGIVGDLTVYYHTYLVCVALNFLTAIYK